MNLTGRIFFFEKKKQKTFDFWCVSRRQRAQRDKSFLVLFFKKEHFYFPGHSPASTRAAIASSTGLISATVSIT
jgi:hypothetical protein